MVVFWQLINLLQKFNRGTWVYVLTRNLQLKFYYRLNIAG
jgi:hypothetical protein